MTGEKINIDDFFKEKLTNHEFSYKPGYWASFEKTLGNAGLNTGLTPGARKILGLTRWKFISLLSVISVTVTVLFVITNNNNHSKTELYDNKPRFEVENNQNKLETEQNEIQPTDDNVNSFEKANNDNETESTDNIIITRQKRYTDKKVVAKKEVSQVDKVNKTDNTPEDKKNITNEKTDNSDKKVSEIIAINDSDKVVKTENTLPDSKINDSASVRDEEKYIRIKYNRFSMRTSGIIMNNFSNDISTNAGYSFLPSIGMGYQWILKNSYSFGVNVDYLRSKNNSLVRNRVTYNYFFFKEKDSVYLKTTGIDFINLNFDLQKQFRERHTLIAGIYLAARLNTQSTKTRVQTNPYNYKSTTTIEKGYFEGLSTLNYGLSLGYQYNLITNIYTGLRFNFTFNDFIDDKLYKAIRHDNINQFSLYLKWMIY